MGSNKKSPPSLKQDRADADVIIKTDLMTGQSVVLPRRTVSMIKSSLDIAGAPSDSGGSVGMIGLSHGERCQ